MPRSGARPLALVGTVLLIAIVALGVGLRAQEIRETYAIGAEDPYTHVVFTREWIEQGHFGDSRWLGTQMYPPGMHAVIGVVAGLSGIDEMVLAKWAPLAFAALAIVGTYALTLRLGGLAAALAAAFLVATMPEHIFRTQLLFPTALDLALLPAWLLLLHEASRPAATGAAWLTRDRVAAAALFVVLAIPLSWMHPWVVPLFGIPGLIYAALRTIRAGQPVRVAARRLALPAAAVSLSCAFAMAFRWDVSDTGFKTFFAKLGPLALLAKLDLPAVALFALLAALLLLASLVGGLVAATLGALRIPRGAGRVAGVALGLALVALVWWYPTARALPSGVSYFHMLGPVAIALAFVGIVAAFARPTPLADMGLAVGMVLGPLTAINVFESPYWPSRSVVYLSFAVALLAGAGVAWLARLPLARVRAAGLRRALVPTAAVTALLLVAGATVASPAKTYDWYRLYDDDDYGALQRLVEKLQTEPRSRVFIQTWQPALFVKALGAPEDVWYSPEFFRDDGARDGQLAKVHGNAYVLVEEYTRKEASKGRADLDFLSGERVALQSADRELLVYQLK